MEGVLAGGVVYYHGMAIAAECLALDHQHRHSAEMNRAIRQAVANGCASAGQLVRKQAQDLRAALKEKRKQAVQSVPKAAFHGVVDAVGKAWETAKTMVAPEAPGPEERTE